MTALYWMRTATEGFIKVFREGLYNPADKLFMKLPFKALKYEMGCAHVPQAEPPLVHSCLVFGLCVPTSKAVSEQRHFIHNPTELQAKLDHVIAMSRLDPYRIAKRIHAC